MKCKFCDFKAPVFSQIKSHSTRQHSYQYHLVQKTLHDEYELNKNHTEVVTEYQAKFPLDPDIQGKKRHYLSNPNDILPEEAWSFHKTP